MDLSNQKAKIEAELKSVLERLDEEFGADLSWHQIRSEVKHSVDAGGAEAEEVLATLCMKFMLPMMYHEDII